MPAGWFRCVFSVLPLLTIAASAGAGGSTIAGLAVRDPASGLVAELNRVRADPPAYALELEQHRQHFRGLNVHEPGEHIYRRTKEGRLALEEAIVALRHQVPLPPLTANTLLAIAAADHVRDQGVIGTRGHGGSDGSSPIDRALRRGLRPWAVGEVISYGPESAVAVVRELIIDDGVPDRGHRAAIFNPDFGRAGAACGPHRGYRKMCVVDFASLTDAPAGALRVPD
jgi:hypothetical protein